MRYVYLLLVVVLLSSCEKNIPEPEKPVILTDSISFLINGKTYVFSRDGDSFGFCNRPVNIKPSTTNNHEYEKDSILYEISYGYGFSSGNSGVSISFSKKYEKDQLQKETPYLLVPLDNSDLFKIGKQSFAVDLHRENTRDGVSIELYNVIEALSTLSTYKPGFIDSKTGLTNNIQSNSKFEITLVKKLDDKHCLIEAEFEVNLFDNNEKLYRLEKGFLRLKTIMSAYGGPY